MSANQTQYPAHVMVRALGVSRSGFYASQGRGPSLRDEVDAALVKDIKPIHKTSKKTYGAPRIHAELAEDGTHVGWKRIERLMKANGIVGVSRRKFITTTVRDERVRPALDLVDRNFYAEEPNQLWVANIASRTIWVFRSFPIAQPTIRREKASSTAARYRKPTQVGTYAMNMAIGQRKPANVIHHSDQGSQFTSIAFGARCKEAGVRPSMGSVDEAYDNAMCESVFATLECELLDRRKFKTMAEARMAVFEFIEGWYNPGRRHSALGYKSPINYEKETLERLELSSPELSTKPGELHPLGQYMTFLACETDPSCLASSSSPNYGSMIFSGMLVIARHSLLRSTRAKKIRSRRVFHRSDAGRTRVRIHNQNMTTAAKAQADRKTFAHLSYRVATRRQSLRRAKLFSILWRFLSRSAS